MKVGVIGLGTVGSPLFHILKYYHKDNVFGYDINKNIDTWDQILETDIVFLCVPTDEDKHHRLNMKVVEKVLFDLSIDGYLGVVVFKSTLRMGYVDSVIVNYDFDIVVFPEWLRVVSALKDTVNPDLQVMGVDDDRLIILVRKVCPWVDKNNIHIVTPQEAVLIKLTSNALGSTKISFANQIQLICKHYDIDVKHVMDVIKQDRRCSPMYLSPGWPFGGYCLPKDTSELAYCFYETELLKGVIDINNRFKKEKVNK